MCTGRWNLTQELTSWTWICTLLIDWWIVKVEIEDCKLIIISNIQLTNIDSRDIFRIVLMMQQWNL